MIWGEVDETYRQPVAMLVGCRPTEKFCRHQPLFHLSRGSYKSHAPCACTIKKIKNLAGIVPFKILRFSVKLSM